MRKFNFFMMLFLIAGFTAFGQYQQTTSYNCFPAPDGTAMTLSFTNVPPPASGGVVTFYYQGDFDFTTENFEVFDEGGSSLGISPAASSQCTSLDSFKVNVTVAQLASWAANGSIDFQLDPDASVSTSTALCSSPCTGAQAKIEYIAGGGPNDATVFSVDSPKIFCAGSESILVTIGNAGTNQIDSVDVHWEIDGVAQPTIPYVGLIDTLNGFNPNFVQITLGSYNFPPGLTEIKVYTSNPNGVADTSNLNDTLTILIGPALSGIYTVNPANPTSGTNFNSISDMNYALNTFGVCGPTLINVSNGTYSDAISLNNVPGLSAANYLTIDGGDSSQTIVSQGAQFGSLVLNGVTNVHVKNFTFEQTNTQGDGVIFSNGTRYDTLSSCVVRVDPTSTNFNLRGIMFSSSTSSNSSGVLSDYNVIQNNKVIGGYYGVYIFGSTSDLNSYNQFLNNEIDSAYYYGMYTYYQDSLEVVGNTINMTNRGNQYSYGFMGYYSNNTRFSKNYVWAGGYASYFYNYNTYSPVKRQFEISNNMLFAEYYYGMYMYYVDSVNIFHNSVNVTGANPALLIGASSTISISNYDLRNNIFSAEGGAVAVLTYEPDTIFVKMNNNLYNTSGATLFDIDGATYTDLPAYQTARPLLNTNSLEGDPQFISSRDMHIIGSFVNDSGDVSVGILEDIDGDIRPMPGASSVDIGADEFDPPTCPPPFNLSASNSTLNSIDFAWTGATSGTSFEYEVVECGNPQGSAGAISGTTSATSITVGGLTASTCYDIYLREVCGRGDTSIWISATGFSTAIGIPYFEDFETFPSGITSNPWPKRWTSTTTTDPNWESNTGQTPSSGTGPTGDHTTGSGVYIYMETSGGAVGDTADFVSPPIFVDSSLSIFELTYWYYFHGNNIDRMDVIIDTNGVEQVVSTIIGQQQFAQTDPWLQDTVLLSGYQGKTVQLKFRGYNVSCCTGDIAIDDVKLDFLPDLSASLAQIVSPQTVCPGSVTPVVEVANTGLNAIDSVTVVTNVNGVYDSVLYVGNIPSSSSVQVTLNPVSFSVGQLYDIEIYTSFPNSGLDEKPSDDTLKILNARTGLSGTYTLDPSQAASSTNYTSFDSLTQDLTAYGICGPTVVNVANGTYNEAIYLEEIPGASASSPLLIDGGDSSLTIVAQGTQYATLTFDGATHVKVANMTIEQTGFSGDAVIFANGSRYDTVSNCVTRVNTSSTSSAYYNISFSSSTTSNSTGVDANYNVVQNNRIVGGYYGIRIYGSTTNLNTYNQILNNEIDSAYYYGIYSYYQDSLEVIGNSINMLSRANQYAYGFRGYYSNNTVFAKNNVKSGGYAAYFYNYNTYSPVNRKFEISNNMLYAENYYGLYMYYVDSVNLFHNSVNVLGTNPALLIGGSASLPVSNYDMRNNIFSAEGGSQAVLTYEPDTIFVKMDNNLYYTTGGTLLDIDGATYTSLSAYQTARPLLNISSLEGDPQFLMSTDLHIVGAFVNDSGDVSVGITEDIDGDVRPMPGATSVDIGADEFDPPTCPPVANFNIDSLSAYVAIAKYIPTTLGNTIEYEIVSCGNSQGSGTASTTQTDSIVFSGLTPSTCYEVYIREICGRGDTSIWAGPYQFTTTIVGPSGVNCISGLPSTVFMEEFDNLSAWSGDIGTGTTAGDWNSRTGATGSVNTGPSGAHSGMNYAYVETSGGYNTTANMVSPLIDLTQATDSAEMSFWMHAYGQDIGTLNVGVSTSQAGPFTTIFTWSGELQGAETDPYQQVGIRLDSMVGQAFYIEFAYTIGNSFAGDIAIDLLKIDACVSCPSPTNQSVSNVTLTSADLDWTENGTATDWELQIGTPGFAIGSGTSIFTTQKPYSLSSLTSSTAYEFYVRSICGSGDTSAWEGPFTFNTANGVPYMQDFETWTNNTTGTINEEGWTNSGTPLMHWEVGQSTTSSGTGPAEDHTIGVGGTFVYLETSSGSTGTTDTLFSPRVYFDSSQSNVQLDFWYHMHGATMSDLEVFVDTNGVLNPITTISGQQHPNQLDPWLNYAHSLVGYQDKSVQIVFVGTRGSSFTGDMAVDDVSLEVVSCPSPYDVTATQVGVDSMMVSWTGGGNASDWEIEFDTAGFTLGNGNLLSKTDTFHLISGLSPNIAYEFYVRDSCAVGDVSRWVGPFEFGIYEACDDFESYQTGLVGNQSLLIEPWAGNAGDAEFSTDTFSSGTQSLKIHDSGINAFSDAVAVMDPYTSGRWIVSVDVFVPSGFGGYYNILHNYTGGGTNVWAIEVMLDSNGTAEVNEGTNGTGVIGTYNYNVGAWNTIEHIIDLTIDSAYIHVNGVNTGIAWQFSLGSTNFGNQFNAMNFYSTAPTGQTPLVYFDDFCVTPVISTSVRELSATDSDISFYPNPTSGEFTIATSGLENDNAQLRVRDMSGKVVFEDNIANSNNAFTKQYDLSGLAKGMYFISIVDGENRINQKLIIQ